MYRDFGFVWPQFVWNYATLSFIQNCLEDILLKKKLLFYTELQVELTRLIGIISIIGTAGCNIEYREQRINEIR